MISFGSERHPFGTSVPKIDHLNHAQGKTSVHSRANFISSFTVSFPLHFGLSSSRWEDLLCTVFSVQCAVVPAG